MGNITEIPNYFVYDGWLHTQDKEQKLFYFRLNGRIDESSLLLTQAAGGHFFGSMNLMIEDLRPLGEFLISTANEIEAHNEQSS